MKYTVIVPGETIEVSFEQSAKGIEAIVGNRTYSLKATTVKPGVYWLNWNQQSIEISVMSSGEAYSVSIGGHQIPVDILDARKKLQRTAHAGKGGATEVRAPMPGKIVRVLADAGMRIDNRQGIVVMEAMKMQNEIKSPATGIIRNIAVAEGETVRAGDLIAIVDAINS